MAGGGRRPVLPRRLAAAAIALVAALLVVYGVGGVRRWVAAPSGRSGTATTSPAEEPANPLSPTPETLALGRRLFMQNCAFCHGPGGRGDGRAARGLQPPPTDLTALGVRRMSDAQLFWLISAGVPRTAMPAWRETLDEGQRWALVTFIRAELQR
jgi:mono/diheme cytochrome c family protein